MKMINSLVATTVVLSINLFTHTSFASSCDAWQAHKKQVIEKCLQATTLTDATPAGEIIGYDDEIGLDVLVIQGTYPQPHMNKQAGRELCLFNRKNQHAILTEADQLIHP